MYKFFVIFFLIVAQFVQGELDELLFKMSKCLMPVDVKNLQKKRYGSKNDGGYVIIKGLNYNGFYSYGVGTNVTFEDDLISAMNDDISCHLYDHTIENFPSDNPRLVWHKQGVGPHAHDDIQTIESQLNANGDSNKKSLFLKMDIEGSEWHTLLNTPKKILKQFKQIVIEYHGLCNDSWGVDLQTKVEVLKKINKLFHVVHVHGNNWVQMHEIFLNGKICLIPEVLEVTYLRKDKNVNTRKSTQKYPIKKIDYPNEPTLPDLKLKTFPFRTR